jgi:circadian clock protein KaiC
MMGKKVKNKGKKDEDLHMMAKEIKNIMKIQKSGTTTMKRGKIQKMNNTSIVKIKTGIEGFEEISKGGIPKGRTTLVSGTSGSGKTLFSLQFLYNGITKFNEPGVFVTFEETPIDIMRNVKSFGWDMDSLVKQNKLMFVDASPDETEKIEVGKYDLDAFLTRIIHAIKKVNAKRVAVDSLSALFSRYENPSIVRGELYKIAAELKRRGVTTIITGERPEEKGLVARFGIEQFVSDNVVLLHNFIEGERRLRKIEILKFRGTNHDTDEAAMVVGEQGIEIYPRPHPKMPKKSSANKIKTGVEGLDEMGFGGFYESSTTLISGASGTGKTLLGMQFILQGAKNNQKGLMLAFEESPEQLLRNAESFGWPWKKYLNNGMITLISVYPEDQSPEAYIKIIKEMVEKEKPKRFVLDSLSGLERIYNPNKFREFVVGLNAYLKNYGVTSYLTNTTKSLLEIRSITETALSTLTDNIIILKYLELGGEMRRIINLLKVRGSDHDKGLREFVIGKNGTVIGESFKGVKGLLAAQAEVIKTPTDVMRKLYDLRKKFENKEISQAEFERRQKELQQHMDKVTKQEEKF